MEPRRTGSFSGLACGIVSTCFVLLACAEGSTRPDPSFSFPAVGDDAGPDARPPGPDDIEADADPATADDAGKDPQPGRCTPADCDDDDPCTADLCEGGKCVHAPDNGVCEDDGNACTGDVCTGGVCTHPATGLCECAGNAECDDQNPCTDDSCGTDKRCTNVNNKRGCANDGTACTDDVCSAGVCSHPDNGTCECRKNDDCNDSNLCTDDSCDANGQCVFANNTAPCAADTNNCTCDVCGGGICTHLTATSCGVATAVAINSFDSAADWDASITTPDARAITGKASFDLTNLEGNNSLYIAESGTATLEIVAPNLAGLTKLLIEIQSDQPGTASMVELGVLGTGASYVDRALATNGAISVGSYTTLSLPLADFAVTPCEIKKVRLDINATGGQKIWRIRSITAE